MWRGTRAPGRPLPFGLEFEAHAAIKGLRQGGNGAGEHGVAPLQGVGQGIGQAAGRQQRGPGQAQQYGAGRISNVAQPCVRQAGGAQEQQCAARANRHGDGLGGQRGLDLQQGSAEGEPYKG